MWARIPSGPDNFKRVIKYQTSFYSGFESVTNIVFSFETNFGWRSTQSYQTLAIIKGNYPTALLFAQEVYF